MSVLQHFCDDGVITELDLKEEWYWPKEKWQLPFLNIYGRVCLRGGLVLDVDKVLRITDVAGQYYIQTSAYSYNLSLKEGNVFRYDNSHAHGEHVTPHHFHRFDPPGTETAGSPFEIGNNWPTLGEVIQQADLYYWEHIYPKQIEHRYEPIDQN